MTIDWSQMITAEQKAAARLDKAWAALRAERDRRIADTDWMVRRHESEKALGADTTLTDVDILALHEWHQALRDLPENTADPESPEWPNSPL